MTLGFRGLAPGVWSLSFWRRLICALGLAAVTGRVGGAEHAHQGVARREGEAG